MLIFVVELAAQEHSSPVHSEDTTPTTSTAAEDVTALTSTPRKTMKSAIGGLLKQGSHFGDPTAATCTHSSAERDNMSKWISPALGNRVKQVARQESVINGASDNSIWISVANRAIDTLNAWQQRLTMPGPQQVTSADQIESAVMRAVERAMNNQQHDASRGVAHPSGVVLLNTKRSVAAAHKGKLSAYIERDLEKCRAEGKNLLEEASLDSSSYSSIDSSALPVPRVKSDGRQARAEMVLASKENSVTPRHPKDVWFNADNDLPRPLYSRVLNYAATEEHLSPTSHRSRCDAGSNSCDDAGAAYSRFIEPTLVDRRHRASTDSSSSFASHASGSSAAAPPTTRILKSGFGVSVSSSASSASASSSDGSLMSWSAAEESVDIDEQGSDASAESRGIFSASSTDSSLDSRYSFSATSSTYSNARSTSSRSSGGSSKQESQFRRRNREVRLDRTKLRLWRP